MTLLSFQRDVLQEIHDPSTSDLVVIARGLGLRKIVCTLLQIYDGPHNLVLLVNASSEEEAAIGEQLGVMGCRNPGLRIVGYEMGPKDRQNLYKRGGLISVTSRILVVDMLLSCIPVDLITGLVILHAEKVTSLSLEAFIIRLFRESNTTGFIKAFSDGPETFTGGLYPLKLVMKELQLRRVHMYPRYHASVKDALGRRRADVVELHQPLTESMRDIHDAIVQCMNATLAELKRANTQLELDDLTVENAYFRSFDAIVRRQLDPVWHRVGPKTKQLVADLATLRNLLTYLLTYDALAFHAYLETIIATNSFNSATGKPRQNQSPWLFTDSANTIFQSAKRRCYTGTIKPKNKIKPSMTNIDRAQTPQDVDNIGDEEAWAVLDEMEGRVPTSRQGQAKEEISKRKRWLPDGIDPVLEELPKWSLLAEILQEIEEEMIRLESSTNFLTPGTNTVLVMCGSASTADLLADYLSGIDRSRRQSEWGRRMMERRLRAYLSWKARLANTDNSPGPRNSDSKLDTPAQTSGVTSSKPNSILSEALAKKDAMRKERIMNRRRIRGGVPGGATNSGRPGSSQTPSPSPSTITAKETGMSAKEREKLGILTGEGEMRVEADGLADFFATQKNLHVFDDEDVMMTSPGAGPSSLAGSRQSIINVDEEIAASFGLDEVLMDENPDYGLMEPEQQILFRVYSDDTDDTLLDDIQPRFIIMYEPNQDFTRRIECYKSANPGLAVRVYFMVYQSSCEEHKFLAGIRREKDAFERLIKERGSMVIALTEDRRANSASEGIVKTISTRIAGGKQLSTAASQVIVDMREFRSALPSLLHAAKMRVVPATLTIGDYILTPEICVERKSIPDLVQSFNSGRLYTQCELMNAHYKQPVLLIEFEEHKSFSLETVSELKSYVKPTGKYPVKKDTKTPANDSLNLASIQSKIVLLTLSFPRLRVLWSSSPFASADIFGDLKNGNAEPDVSRAIATGAEDDAEAGAGVNTTAEELLRSLPGVTAKNVKYVMSKVGSVKEFSGLSLQAVQDILGNEPGKACWEFMHYGD